MTDLKLRYVLNIFLLNYKNQVGYPFVQQKNNSECTERALNTGLVYTSTMHIPSLAINRFVLKLLLTRFIGNLLNFQVSLSNLGLLSINFVEVYYHISHKVLE